MPTVTGAADWTGRGLTVTGTITWTQWIDCTITAASATAWTQWTNCTTTGTNIWAAWNTWDFPAPIPTRYSRHETQPTPAQAEQIRRTAAEIEARREEALANRRAAHDRAMELLISALTVEQHNELVTREVFHVRGSRGRRYCIRARGQAGNVSLVDDSGTMLARFCCHPGVIVPDPDAWLAQKLALQHDEDAFLAVANLSEGQRPDPARVRVMAI